MPRRTALVRNEQGQEYDKKQRLRGFLKPFGIAPSTIRVSERTVKGYHLAMFEDAFGRYLDPVPASQGVTT